MDKPPITGTASSPPSPNNSKPLSAQSTTASDLRAITDQPKLLPSARETASASAETSLSFVQTVTSHESQPHKEIETLLKLLPGRSVNSELTKKHLFQVEFTSQSYGPRLNELAKKPERSQNESRELARLYCARAHDILSGKETKQVQ